VRPAAVRSVSVHLERLRALAGILALDRSADVWLLLFPALSATWLATRGAPDVSALIALLLAYALVRAAAWMWYVPGAASPEGIPIERRRLGMMLFVAGLCFAVPLGWPVLILVLSLGLAIAWFALRRHSYLAQPVLATAVALVVASAWSAQHAGPGKAAGLLGLATFLWVLAALVTRLPEREGASLVAVFGPALPLVVAVLLSSALLALYLLGHQVGLGVFHRIGLITAGLLTAASVVRLALGDTGGAYTLQLWWGGATFAGLAAHYLCACAVPP